MSDFVLLDSGTGEKLLLDTAGDMLLLEPAAGGGGSDDTGTLRLNVVATLRNGELERQFTPGQQQVTQNSQGSTWRRIIVGTSEEDLPIPNITREGYCFMRNLDPVNYVTYGPKSGTMVPFGRIEAGEAATLRLEPGITVTAQANAGPVSLDFNVLED